VNGMKIWGAIRIYNAGPNTTTFFWLVCGEDIFNPCPTPVGGFHELGHFTVDLGPLAACGGASIKPGTTSPFLTADPLCFPTPVPTPGLVNWDAAGGVCQTFTLVLGGAVATGPVQVGTEADSSCPLTTVLGPACPP